MKHSRYTLAIMVLYAVFLPLVFIFDRPVLRFGFSLENFSYVVIIIAATAIGFSLFLQKLLGWKRLRTKVYFLPMAGYALIIALAEEIIFRGILQGYFQSIIGALPALGLSTLIFGFAHLPNGATGWQPKFWSWKFAVLAFLAGLPLSALFALTASLLLPVILHLCFLVAIQFFSEK